MRVPRFAPGRRADGFPAPPAGLFRKPLEAAGGFIMAWVFQDPKQKAKHGDDCKWSIGWRDAAGKKHCEVVGSETKARKAARKKEGELAAGAAGTAPRIKWSAFRKEYEAEIAKTKKPKTLRSVKTGLGNFEKYCTLGRVSRITTATIIEFRRNRKAARGRKKGSTASPASVNHDLRVIKAALNYAHDVDYLPKVPKIKMLGEPEKLPVYVTGEHFTKIYNACDAARFPEQMPFPPGDWWRALVTFGYMTGWRIGEILALRRSDLDLETGYAITRAANNKGKRDEVATLHPVVVDHLTAIKTFDREVFSWPHDRRTLDLEFHEIQREAGIHLACDEEHEHTPCCHVYGFHDLRRAFATVNAETMGADVLQRLMRHRSYQTTQRYINMAKQVAGAVEQIHVPSVLRSGATG
jgi:integrase